VICVVLECRTTRRKEKLVPLEGTLKIYLRVTGGASEFDLNLEGRRRRVPLRRFHAGHSFSAGMPPMGRRI
jgi:hypothetical protein